MRLAEALEGWESVNYLSVCSGIEAFKLHGKARDLSGMKSGRLDVIRPIRRGDDGHTLWLCKCSCGKEKEIVSNSLTRLKPVQSCGCMNKTAAQKKVKTEGPWNEGKSYTIKNGEHCYKTRHGWAIAARKIMGNKCEICGWDKAKCDVHHKHKKSNGGLHTLSNARILCPNCHREEHEKCAS